MLKGPYLHFSGAACLLLAACGEVPAFQADNAASPPPVAEETETASTTRTEPGATPIRGDMVKATIDWDAARADLARRNATARSFGDEDENAVQIQSSDTPAVVPVLLPTGIVSIQRSGPGPSFRQTNDGYFARYPGLKYDIVVHGTNEIAATVGDVVIRDEDFDFVDLMDGAQVSLSRYGADYLISFECNGAEGGMESCITEEEAFEVARGLIIAGSR